MTGKSLVQKEKGKDRQKRKRKSWKVIQADLRLRKRKGNQWKAHREIHAWPTVEWLMRCAGFMFVHASVSDWLWMFNGNPWAARGNPSCSFNCTDLRKSYTEVTVPLRTCERICTPSVCACVCERFDAVCWFVLFPRWLVSIKRPGAKPSTTCSLFPCDLTPFHFSISLSSTAAACFFIFLFPDDDRKRVKCEIRKSVCK